MQNRKDPVRDASNKNVKGHVHLGRPLRSMHWSKKQFIFIIIAISILALIYFRLANDIKTSNYGSKAIDHLAISQNLHTP